MRTMGLGMAIEARRRMRRTYAELFLDALNDMSGGNPTLQSNNAVREKLGWDVDRYNRIKEQLREDGSIIVGRGRGGTVALATAKGAQALRLFISYSHRDTIFKDQLVSHLEPLRRLNLISEWHDRSIQPGQDWGQEIAENLESADIIIVLVSIDFINSKYCYDIELERALERHAEGSAVVVPIILRNCLWQHSPFAKIQALPKDAKAIATWSDRDEALTSVAEGIRLVAEQRLAAKG